MCVGLYACVCVCVFNRTVDFAIFLVYVYMYIYASNSFQKVQCLHIALFLRYSCYSEGGLEVCLPEKAKDLHSQLLHFMTLVKNTQKDYKQISSLLSVLF